MDAMNKAIKAVLREALDAVDVHPCDVHDDAVRAKWLYDPMADLYAAAIAPPVAAGSVDRTKLHDMTLPDTETRDWYFDCDGHYIDVELRKDGHYSIYFRNRADGGKGWLDTGVMRERAEKAEADLKQVNEWRAAALTESQNLGELWAAKVDKAEARIAELEAQLAAAKPYDLKA